MAKVTINDIEIETEEGRNLVDVAEENGIEIPHYCYHPGLSVAGQCRMCYVEQEGNPKLQVGCNIQCKDGMKFVTNSPKVKEAVKWSLEFHLINHPIDCPICDQAGECGLQDYYMAHGKYESEMRENKVKKEKAVDLGEKIVLDKERCILCSRCVRFTNEVSGTNEFAIFNRGDRSVIGTVDNKPLSGNYQLNTVDICPVGALTSKDFRFEKRVWFLSDGESVCGGCSKGCNVYIHHNSGKHLYRLKPRFNPEVNGYWMCDEGRMTYKNSNYDARITKASLGGVKMPLADAFHNWTSDLRTIIATERTEEIGVWIHPHMTNEELTSILETLKEKLSITRFFSEDIQAAADSDQSVDGLLLRSDRYPNSKGFLELLKKFSVTTQRGAQLAEALSSGSITHLIVFAPEGEVGQGGLQEISGSLSPAIFCTLLTPSLSMAQEFPSALAIPTISHFEKSGTMTNHEGVAQRLEGDFRMFGDTCSTEEAMRLFLESYERPAKTNRRMEA